MTAWQTFRESLKKWDKELDDEKAQLAKDAPEKKLLQELKAGAKQTCPEFENLYKKCMAM